MKSLLTINFCAKQDRKITKLQGKCQIQKAVFTYLRSTMKQRMKNGDRSERHERGGEPGFL
jgi:hypothetical protein